MIKSETKQGEWIPAYPDYPAYCDYAVSTVIEKPATLGSYHVYRVMVRPKIYGNDVPARASWHWTRF